MPPRPWLIHLPAQTSAPLRTDSVSSHEPQITLIQTNVPQGTRVPGLHHPLVQKSQTGGPWDLLIWLSGCFPPPWTSCQYFKIQLSEDLKKVVGRRVGRGESDLWLFLKKKQAKLKIWQPWPLPSIWAALELPHPSHPESICSALHHSPYHSLLPHSTGPFTLFQASLAPRREPEAQDVKWLPLFKEPVS